MYNELLKQHEEILKKLTEKASKETGFDERGQFINIQKMIEMEIRFIKNLNEIIEEHSDTEDTLGNSTKQIEEVDTKKPNKYVYAYTDMIDEYKFKLIYFENFENENMMCITNVRSLKSIEDVSDALFVAKSLGYKSIINNVFKGNIILSYLQLEKESFIACNPSSEIYTEAYLKFIGGNTIITRQSDKADMALKSFNDKFLEFNNGGVKYIPEVEDDNSSLLKEIILAYYLIKEDNNK